MSLAPREFAEMFHPLREALTRLAKESSRLIEEGVTRSDGFELLKAGQPYPADIYETTDEYIVEVAIPGIRPDGLRITATARALTVRGNLAEAEEMGTPGQYVLRERYSGEFDRTLHLPNVIDPTRVRATADYGVLRLRAQGGGDLAP